MVIVNANSANLTWEPKVNLCFAFFFLARALSSKLQITVFLLLLSKVRTKNLKECPQLPSLFSGVDWKGIMQPLPLMDFPEFYCYDHKYFRKNSSQNGFMARLKQFVLALTLSSTS